MIIKMLFTSPIPDMTGNIKVLWQEAFGDTDEFIDSYMESAYSAKACRCAIEDNRIVAALHLGVTVMDPYGDLEMIPCNKLGFSYRHSVLQEGNDTVVSVVFQLTPGEPEEIRGKMKELQAKRSASQPLDLPSAGSAFKRPVGGYAAALIDQAGLKGFSVGGAAISTKHAGFAVNLGGATAEDVKNLLSQVSDLVYDQSGIRLEPEVRIW